MIAYHGTTKARARRIFDQGLQPLPPSRLVWFAESRTYAMGRAETQARRTDDVPTVLACSLDLQHIRQRLGGEGVVHKKGIIAIDGPVTIDMLQAISSADLATVPEEVAAWVNRLLGLRDEAQVTERHAGINRLSVWINAQLAAELEPTLAKFAGGDAPRWIEQGLRDPEPCVRTAAAGCLDQLDPKKHRKALRLASHDSNPDIAARAHKRLLKKKHR